MVQTVFLIKLSQAHHGLLTHTPLQEEGEGVEKKKTGRKYLDEDEESQSTFFKKQLGAGKFLLCTLSHKQINLNENLHVSEM